MTTAEFLKKYRVTSSSEWTPSNPHMEGMDAHANHYKVTLKFEGRKFTLYYSKGSALVGMPTTAEVLECLALDMTYIQYGLDDFVDSLGYTYAKGKKVFDLIETQSQKMFKLLGFEAFQDFKQIEEV